MLSIPLAIACLRIRKFRRRTKVCICAFQCRMFSNLLTRIQGTNKKKTRWCRVRKDKVKECRCGSNKTVYEDLKAICHNEQVYERYIGSRESKGTFSKVSAVYSNVSSLNVLKKNASTPLRDLTASFAQFLR
jgi:hypothetical protein